jgi:hypothetical protein
MYRQRAEQTDDPVVSPTKRSDGTARQKKQRAGVRVGVVGIAASWLGLVP